MFGQDKLWAYLAVLLLWASYAFTLWRIFPELNDDGVLLALAISGGLVLLFNTAAIVAMINHFAEDKQNIYGLDVHYLDLMNKNRG